MADNEYKKYYKKQFIESFIYRRLNSDQSPYVVANMTEDGFVPLEACCYRLITMVLQNRQTK